MAGYPFLRPPRQPDDLGELGGYRILQLLGDGAMGFVFLAQEKTLDRRLALKVMRPEYSATPEGRERFLREARASAKVESDHVVTIYQVGEDNGTPFIAMELLEGMSLQTWLAKRESLPSISSVFKVARDLFRGLADAHVQGLVHRDIKPSNLWIEKRTGRIKILDFGLTKAGDGADNATRSGAILGTPAYMAPEQANGQPVDQRADLFSAGVVLFEVMTKKNPFRRGSILATLKAIGSEEAPPVAGVRQDAPPALASLVDQLLRREFQERPAQAKEAQRFLALAEQEYRSLSGRAPTSPDDPPSALREVTESIAKTKDDQQSDPGSFLFDTNGFTPAKTISNSLVISGHVKKWLFGVVIAAVLLLGFLSFQQFSTTPTQDRPAQAIQDASRPPQMGPAVLKKDEGAQSSAQVAQIEGSVTTKEIQLSQKEAIPANDAFANLLKQVSREMLRKNPGIKEPEFIRQSNGAVECYLEGMALNDLSPLAAIEKITVLEVRTSNSISDLSPLIGKPLERLLICQGKINDISPLRGMPLTHLVANQNQILSLEPLAGTPLQHIELTGNQSLSSLEPLKNSPLMNVRFLNTNVASLEPLRGKRISFLEAAYCPISDIGPLSGMPLEVLNISGTKVTSIAALKDCPLKILSMEGTKIHDLSPLVGKAIKNLVLGDVSGADLNVLKKIDIENISGNPKLFEAEFLASWPNAKFINGKTKDQVVLMKNDNGKPLSMDAESLERKRKPDLVLNGHPYEITIAQFSQDGRAVASASISIGHENKDTIKVWNSVDGLPEKSIEIFESGKINASFVRDLKKVALGGEIKIGVWNMENGQKIYESDGNLGGIGGGNSLVFSQDGKFLAGGSWGTLQIVDTKNGLIRLRWDAKNQYPNPAGLGVGSFCFSKDARFFAFSVGMNQDMPTDVFLFDLASKRLLRTLKGHTHGVSLAFSPNSRFLVSGSRDRTIQFWDLSKPSATPKPAFVLKRGVIPPVRTIAWSPDGKLVAAGDSEGNVTFFEGFDSVGFAEIPNLYIQKAHDGIVSTIDFSPDSKRLVTGGFDKKVKVWTLPEKTASK